MIRFELKCKYFTLIGVKANFAIVLSFSAPISKGVNASVDTRQLSNETRTKHKMSRRNKFMLEIQNRALAPLVSHDVLKLVRRVPHTFMLRFPYFTLQCGLQH